MKNFLKLSGLVLAAVLMLSSCKEVFGAGGTIEVTNGQSFQTFATAIKGELSLDVLGTVLDGLNETGILIPAGGTHKFSFDENGAYTVVALPPAGFHKTVILLAGSTEKITIE